MVVASRIHEFVTKRPASFRVWLRSRAIEQLADQHRRHVTAEMRTVRREKSFNDASSMAIARTLLSETPSKILQRNEFAEQVRDLIESLNNNDREMLTLRHAEGLTNSDSTQTIRSGVEPTRRKSGGCGIGRRHLLGRGHMTHTQIGSDREDLLGQVVDEFFESVAHGETPDISDYLRRYPEIADLLKIVIPAMRATEHAATRSEPTSFQDASPPEKQLSEFFCS